MIILPALPEDAPTLTEICVAAKRYWGYPEERMQRWSSLLTVTPEYIQEHPVYKAVREDQVAGWYALTGQGKTLILDHLWIRPAFIRQGIGRALFQHAVRTAAESGAARLEIESDPNARGFYETMGARFLRYIKTDMERELPYLEIELPNLLLPKNEIEVKQSAEDHEEEEPDGKVG